MSATMESTVVPAASISPARREEMLSLMQQYFENVTRTAFLADLAEKQWVVMLLDRQTDALCALAENALSQGDLSTAQLHLQAASNLLGTSENKWLQTLVCYFRGLLAQYAGDAVTAMMLLDRVTALAREGQYRPDLARALVALARAKRTLGQVSPASELLMEGLELFRALGHKLGIAEALEELGAVSAVRGDGAQAAMLLSTAHALREGMGAPLPPVDRAAYDSVLAACRAQLGEAAFAEAWAHAAARSWQEVVEEVLKLRQN